MLTKSNFYSQGIQFLENVQSSLNRGIFKFELHWQMDHLCYRVESVDRYEEVKKSVSEFANMMIESMVNGRPIATFKLHEPFYFGDDQIDVIEIPAPKSGKTVEEGFEHFEMVVDEPFPELIRKFSNQKMSLSGLKKDFNQELEIQTPDFNFKFHHLSLESVIHLEKNNRAQKALQDSKVLQILRDYNPLVAGTFPLDLHNEQSDLDILIFPDPAKEFQKTIRDSFGSCSKFEMKQIPDPSSKAWLVNFEFENVPFEIFAQDKESVKQIGYRHFLIEERLLKFGGNPFRQEVKNWRQQGLKTEPAFAAALKLAGDPYEELLKLQLAPHEKIKTLLRQAFAG